MAATKVKLKQLAQDGATTGQAIVWDGSVWAPDSAVGDLQTVTTAGNITDNEIIIDRADSDTDFGLQFDGTQENIFKIIEHPSGTASELTDFNIVRGLFPAASAAGDNQVVSIGFNTTAGGSIEDTGEAEMSLRFENNYRNGSTPNSFEFHVPQVTYPGGASRRPLSGYFSNDSTDLQGNWSFSTDHFSISDYETNTQQATWGFNSGGAYAVGITFLTSASIRFATNDNQALVQRNAANSAYVNLIKADSSDQVLLGGGGESRVAAYNHLRVTNTGLISNENNELLVGNSSNKTNLTVYGNGNIPLKITGGTSTKTWAFESGSSAFALVDITTGGNPVYIYNSANTGEFIFRNGNLGIGGVSGFFPEAKLHVTTASGATAKLQRLENSTGFNDIFRSTATPEAAITANPGDLALTSISSAGGLYIKESGTGNTGWSKVITNSNTGLGTGFTAGGGSGTIPASTIATLGGAFTIKYANTAEAIDIQHNTSVFIGSPDGDTWQLIGDEQINNRLSPTGTYSVQYDTSNAAIFVDNASSSVSISTEDGNAYLSISGAASQLTFANSQLNLTGTSIEAFTTDIGKWISKNFEVLKGITSTVVSGLADVLSAGLGNMFNQDVKFDPKKMIGQVLESVGTMLIGIATPLTAPNSIESKEKYQLSKREIQCLTLLAKQYSIDAIAKSLHISERTVNYHIQRLNKKLGAQNKHQSVMKALQKGLITL